MKFILGTKLGMSQVFRDDGTVVPVTRVQAGPCVVTQIKTAEKDGASAVQIGFGEQKKYRLNRAQQGHLKDIMIVRYTRDFRTNEQAALARGDHFGVSSFAQGDKVQVVGTSKGKGFQGVVKRHGFHGSPASHGHKDQLRMPGSIGAGGVQRVFKGKRMAGHMGDQRVTVKNLEVVEIHPETNELFIKGAVPGARGGLLLISSQDGELVVEKLETQAQQDATVATSTETPVAENTQTLESKDMNHDATVATEEQVQESTEKKSTSDNSHGEDGAPKEATEDSISEAKKTE